MDCDLQDKPEEIINLYNEACKGYDIVLAARKNSQMTFKKVNIGILLILFLSGKFNGDIGNFGIYHKR